MSQRFSWKAGPAIAALVVMLGAACGGGAEPGAGAPGEAGEQPGAEQKAATSEITNASVVEVVSGQATTVRSALATETPTLFWFWAPH